MRGYVAPYLLFILLFSILSFQFLRNLGSQDVKGSSTQNESASFGITLYVSSRENLWELVTYLCRSEAECLESYNSGTRVSVVSGESTPLKEVFFKYSKDWDSYKYLKVFVRPDTLKNSIPFRIASIGGVPDTQIKNIKHNGQEYEVILLPIANLKQGSYGSALFSDH